MYEHRLTPLLSRVQFIKRILGHLLLSLFLIALALSVGIFGYHHLENFSWVDSLLNASMILGGMGPVGTLTTNEGKIFASCFLLS